MKRAHDLEAEVRGLDELDLTALRQIWRERFGDPPALRSVDLLRHMLAWRLQVAALGGLDRQTERALRRTSKVATRAGLAPGTRMSRLYRGVRHEVEVTPSGFRYGDRTHASLSAIAREITGMRWNGWRFFGLADGEQA